MSAAVRSRSDLLKPTCRFEFQERDIGVALAKDKVEQ
jgi:hypothetical protein